MKRSNNPNGNPLGATAWRLTDRDIVEIRLRVAAGESKASLAREYKVSAYTVYYHCKSGKDALREPYSTALQNAYLARRRGDRLAAAQHLRTAADVLDGTIQPGRVAA
jgi:hypothetical protein